MFLPECPHFAKNEGCDGIFEGCAEGCVEGCDMALRNELSLIGLFTVEGCEGV